MPKSKKSGFTLIEVLIATSISAMVLAGVLSTTIMAMRISEMALSEADATGLNVQIRARLERELRGVSEVVSRSSTKFEFITQDAFGNEKQVYYELKKDFGVYLVRYEVYGSDPEEVLLDDINDGLTSVEFEYYNQLGEVTTTAAESNAVQITIERSIDGVDRSMNRDLSVMMVMFRNKIYDVEID